MLSPARADEGSSSKKPKYVFACALQSFEPPSTWMVSPVIHRASSDARKATTSPMSSGCAMRLSACIPRTNSRPASVLMKFDMSPPKISRASGVVGVRGHVTSFLGTYVGDLYLCTATDRGFDISSKGNDDLTELTTVL